MTASEPRVWVGVLTECHHWRWWRSHRSGSWSFSTGQLNGGDIFIHGPDEPTIDPADMETIRTCKVVDWI